VVLFLFENKVFAIDGFFFILKFSYFQRRERRVFFRSKLGIKKILKKGKKMEGRKG